MRRETIRSLHRQLHRKDTPPLRLIVVHGACGTIESDGEVLPEMPETGVNDLVLTLNGSRYDDGPRPVFARGVGAVHVGPKETPAEWDVRAAEYKSPAFKTGDTDSNDVTGEGITRSVQ